MDMPSPRAFLLTRDDGGFVGRYDSVTLWHFTAFKRVPEPITTSVTLAGGGIRRYSRGHRFRYEFRWTNAPDVFPVPPRFVGGLPGATAPFMAALEALASPGRRATQQEGRSRLLLHPVDWPVVEAGGESSTDPIRVQSESLSFESIPGTSPVRHNVDLVLRGVDVFR